ncbi:ferrochelatase [Betaproteobacteria bacterium]|nr:ferrochelatase [Betaproteobacteria bacterium]GHU46530.1 ferrochelatase [Betaproteobacteria bacterium]
MPPPPDQPIQTGILLINLGTPNAPTPAAVRRYLAEFLADRRVVELPRLLWLPLLHGIILNTRPRQSAAKYALIWNEQGSPLLTHTQQQARLLQAEFDARQVKAKVFYAMRYGKPTVGKTLDDMMDAGITRILTLPLYPQYAASTTASAQDAVCDWLCRRRNQPELRSVRSFPEHPGYIAALAANIKAHWRTHTPDSDSCLVMSFHGLPEKSRQQGDPYYNECQRTGALLAEKLNLAPAQYRITFQSRFGREAWLQPYTAPTLQQLARDGVRRVGVICPGFAADCLETLEEIALTAKADFVQAGGQEFHYLPALNETPEWISALADIAQGHLTGWDNHK